MRMLIIKPSSFGDIVHGLQVAQSIRAQIPGVHIDWVARNAFSGLVECCDTVDRTFLFHRRGGLRRFIDLLREIRSERYDVAIDMQGLLRSGVMLAAARAERKLGRGDAREGAAWFARELAPFPNFGMRAHAVEILLQFLPLLDLRPRLVGQLSFRPGNLGSTVSALLEDPPVLVFPTSRRPEKVWSGFSDLTARLLRELPGKRIAWLGTGPAQTPPEDPRFINLIDQTGIEEMIALVSAAPLVVANDSGPMHLAAAVGRPVVAVFGPTQPERFGPYPLDFSRHQVVVAPEGDLTALDAEPVVEAVRRALT